MILNIQGAFNGFSYVRLNNLEKKYFADRTYEDVPPQRMLPAFDFWQ
jgi:hypothetical protein